MNRRNTLLLLFAACGLGSDAIAAGTSGPRAPAWTSLQAMHVDYLQAFVHSDGFGIRRVTPMMALMQGGTLTLDNQQLRVEDVQMIGIAKHDPPIIYPGGVWKFQHPDNDQAFLQAEASRPINGEEKSILAGLEKGQAVISMPGAGGPVATGAIRATDACLQCHQSKKAGDLLGAFVYKLKPVQ